MTKVSKFTIGFLLAGAMTLAACGQKEGAAAPADLVLRGGTIYAVDGLNTVAEAIAVRDGKIIYVGSNAGASALVGASTRITELDGQVVLPGFTDSHAHLPDGGAGVLGIDLAAFADVDAILAAVRDYAENHPDLPVIHAAGWDLSLFPGGNPKKEMLDAVISDRPVILTAADGHNSWVNSKALEAAGITAATADPQNGRLERDADGNPTGTLREAAQTLVADMVPEPSLEQAVKNIEAGLAYQAANGITSSIDAAIPAGINEEAYLALSERPDLPGRVRVSLLAASAIVTSVVTTDNATETVQTLDARRALYRARSKGRVDGEAVKIFVDGVVENFTAAMVVPYVGSPMGPEHRGTMNLSEAALTAYITALDAEGFQVHMHALGDQAVRSGLNAVEAAAAVNGARDRRPHLAHLEVVRPEDIARFAPLGATANLQTLWHFRDSYIADLTEPFMQDDLRRWLYPAHSFAAAGARLAWGSDWPVSTSDPFQSMEVAVTRKSPAGPDAPALVPEEALTVDEMIHALTMGGAYLMSQDDIRGSLEVGKRADLIIIDADPYNIAPSAISDIRVQETFVEGKSVYKR